MDRLRSRAPAGITLVETLVSFAVIGLLLALLLPSVSYVRETMRRTTCQNQLRNLALAARNYESRRNTFPPGVRQATYNSAPAYRGVSLFVYLLNDLEQDRLRAGWDLRDPMTNAAPSQGYTRTAVVLEPLVCPSDTIVANPVTSGVWHYALTSYGGNGGSRSYMPALAKLDGVFHTTGPGSEPDANQLPVRAIDIRDGLAQTVLFGERSHDDPNYETFAANGWGDSLVTWGWWAPSGGRKAAGHVLLSALAPLNFRLPATYGSPATASISEFQETVAQRLTAFGSNHSGGANFAFADGSVRFVPDAISLDVLRALCTRATGDIPQDQ